MRKSDSRRIYRFQCGDCGKTLSRATGHAWFGQHKRRINYPLYQLLCSAVSQRRAAKLLRVHRTTVARKFRLLAQMAREEHRDFLKELPEQSISEIQFDEMESFEHTKLKPVSIALVVSRQRQILSFQVARMPAKGLLSEKAKKKYGYRRDERKIALAQVLREIKPLLCPQALVKSDKNPMYPALVKKILPHAVHQTTKATRARGVGQGELKATAWDPIFSFNHTAAMHRYNLSRLVRKTWCTTKTIQGLYDHLSLYAMFHNQVLLPKENAA